MRVVNRRLFLISLASHNLKPMALEINFREKGKHSICCDCGCVGLNSNSTLDLYSGDN